MSFEYQVYRKEIFDFLSTVTIKFEALAKYKARDIAKKFGVSITLDRQNPYYINLCGEYSEWDTPMYVTTIETGEQVLFDKYLRVNFPKTAAVYKIGSDELKLLQTTYPEQISLIRNILYPVADIADIDTVINTPNLTVMSYDSSILYPTEQESIVAAISNFVEYMAIRWYVPDFDYEDLYPAAFYAQLWVMLEMVIVYQRIANLRTPYVHPHHVWEYLISNGFEDHRDILTHEQALFLYRNLKYLYQNRGKTSNLEILAENLIDKLYVSLVGKNVYQETASEADNCILIPEIISEDVKTRGSARGLTKDFTEFEAMDTFVRRMYFAEVEINNTVRHIDDTESTIGTSRINYLPTKFLEFKKHLVDTRLRELIMRYFYETLLFKYSKNRLSFRLQFTAANTVIKLNLDIGEAIALFNYALLRSQNEKPEDIDKVPVEAYIRTTYQETRPVLSDYYIWKRESIFAELAKKEIPCRYPWQSIFDAKGLLDDIDWSTEVFTNKTDFHDFMIHNFEAMVVHITDLMRSASLLRHDAEGDLYYKQMLATETAPVNLIPFTSYDAWFKSNDALLSILNTYDADFNSYVMWDEFADQLLTELIPLDNDIVAKYLAGVRDDTDYYNSLKRLFIKMTSYNVQYLDTTREQVTYLFILPICMDWVFQKYGGCFELPGPTNNVDFEYQERDCIPLGDATAPRIYMTETHETDCIPAPPSIGVCFRPEECTTIYTPNFESEILFINSDPNIPLQDGNRISLIILQQQ